MVSTINGQLCLCWWYIWGSSGPGLFRSLLKCSAHLLICSSVDVNVFLCLPLIGVSVTWYLAASFSDSPPKRKTSVLTPFSAMHLQMMLKMKRRKNVTILMGELNAEIGADNTGYEHVMGKHGLGRMNENGEQFADFRVQNNLVIGDGSYGVGNSQAILKCCNPPSITTRTSFFFAIFNH